LTQRVRGSIDLLLETPDGFIIIDHKSFPGKFADWEMRALSHLPQLHVYKHVLQERTGRKVKELYIHMPIVGAMIKVG
jgi:ATP-dependent exoDNAse (exonuclease V) beta subunit